MKRKILIVVAALVVLGVAAIFWTMRPIAPVHPALVNADQPQIIPLRGLYADAAARWRFRLSPDGKKLAWLESKWFKPALWVRSLSGKTTTIFHTDDEVRWYTWSANGRYLIYQADRDGWENDVIVSIDTTNPDKKPRTYDFGKNVKSYIWTAPKDGGDEIVISHNGRDRSLFDLYRLNLATGKTSPMGVSTGRGISWSIDRSGKIYARKRHLKNGEWVFEKRDGDNWREVLRGGFEDTFYTITAPNKDGIGLAVSARGRNTTALVKLDYKTAGEEVVYAHDKVDIGGVTMSSDDKTLQMVTTDPDYQHRKIFDPAMKAAIDLLKLPENASVHLVSRTKDGYKLLLEVHTDRTGYETRLVDLASNTVEVIATPRIARHKDIISPVKPVFIKARDGLEIPAFLSTPKGVKGPAPLVILIHGGPTARVHWGYHSTRIWLNNRGYAVLDVNYRASWGYGRKFREAAAGEVSRRMDDDITDARAWAVKRGIADPAKVAVLGGSFGGLKVMTAMTRNPDLYAAGININGVADLNSMLKEVPVYWRGWPFWYRKYLGDPKDPKQRADIADRSPINHADKLKSPVLVIQATNDVRVIKNQADRLVAALKKHNAPHEYVLVKGVGHQFRQWGWKKRLITYRRMERFLAKHLGGRADGFDYAVVGAHILPW